MYANEKSQIYGFKHILNIELMLLRADKNCYFYLILNFQLLLK